MRYKFRGKRSDDQGWVYGGLIINQSNQCFIALWDSVYLIKGKTDAISNRIIPAIPESVGQWTGRVDRHGKEIYEGDIAKEDDSNWGYGGEYDTTHDGYLYNPVEFRNGAFYIGDNLLGEWSCFEIIGNIHDNPERLEGE